MSKQLYYSLRSRLSQRLAGILILVGLNAVFSILGYFDVYGGGGKITAVTLSSIALCGWFVVCVLCDADAIRGLVSAPMGYHTILTPVPAWKMVLARVITVTAQDFIGYVIAITGVVIQTLLLSGYRGEGSHSDFVAAAWFALIVVLQYMILFLAILFVAVLVKSVFYSFRGRTILAIVVGVVVMYALSWMDAATIPFGYVHWINGFAMVDLTMGFNAGMMAYLLVTLIKLALLFFTSSYLIERKINL